MKDKQHIRMRGGLWCLFRNAKTIHPLCIARDFRRLITCHHIRGPQ
jgi:hypothetical protein